MAVFFFDTSAIVKRYVRELGTAWVQSVTNQGSGNRIYIARITMVEIASAVTRRQRGDTLSAAGAANILTQFHNDIVSEYRLIEISSTLLSSAMQLAESHALRAYDAVQLAAALEFNQQRQAASLPAVTLVSADGDLNRAATLSGLPVEDANLHP